jgi:type IV pilus assembly protein PilE
MSGAGCYRSLLGDAQNPDMQTSAPLPLRGFTLIELMVVVVIAGILAAVAYPAYTAHIQRGRRADAMKILTAVSQAQERYRGNRNAFASSLAELGFPDTPLTNYYTFDIKGVGVPESLVSGYQVSATVKSGSAQASDTRCATLAIRVESAAVSYVAKDTSDAVTSSDCWPR